MLVPELRIGPREADPLGACRGADAAAEAFRVPQAGPAHGRPKGPVEAREERHQGAERAEAPAPAAKDEDFKEKKARKNRDRPGEVIHLEEPPKRDEKRKGEAYRADEAENGKSEEGGRCERSRENGKRTGIPGA